MAAVILILVFLYFGGCVADPILGCSSVDKKDRLTIDSSESSKNATQIKFLTDYNVSSEDQCIEGCCNKGDCNIALFHYGPESITSSRNCIHLLCYPFDACVFRESNDTILAIINRFYNSSDSSDESYQMEKYNLKVISDFSENQIQTNNHKIDYQNSSLISNNSKLDTENLENVLLKLIEHNFTSMMTESFENVSDFISVNNRQNTDFKLSVKKQLKMKNSLPFQNLSKIQIDENKKWEVLQMNISDLLYITSKVTLSTIDNLSITRRPLNQTTIIKKTFIDFISSKKEVNEKILIYIVMSIGAITIFITGILIGKHFIDSWKHRHYAKMDYLIDGMYNWKEDKD